MFGTLPPAPAGCKRPGQATRRPLAAAGGLERGDNYLLHAILGKVRAQSPQTYKTLFVDRNMSWAGWIANRMDKPGTVFVAVGTGHLVGPDSVQRHLAARGIPSARIS